jgi:uncharacterized protein YcsI (UPF0317 family)
VSQRTLEAIRDLIARDIGNRGLQTDPAGNLVSACPDDFAAACRSIAEHPQPVVGIVTGFYIPNADPPAAETDGPLGAVFLARALMPLGISVVLITDSYCAPALAAGLAFAGLRKSVPLVPLPDAGAFDELTAEAYWESVAGRTGALTHLIAVERVGPSHTPASVAAQPGSTPEEVERFRNDVPSSQHDRCQTFRGVDITANTAPTHLLFEAEARRTAGVVTIAVGDGGNELGMGKVRWEVVRRNVPGGGPVACRVAADYLIVSGVSNWGAYGLATGVRLLRGADPDLDLFDIPREQRLLEAMVFRGPLVDGMTGKEDATVDGLPFEKYAEPLRRLPQLLLPPDADASSEADSVFPILDAAFGAYDDALGPAARVRHQARIGELIGPTAGLAPGYVQANLVVVPRDLAYDFLLFCQRNPKPCPLLDVTDAGSYEPALVAANADLRTDVPGYRVYRTGELVEETRDLLAWWRDDLVAFLIGCSFTFDTALQAAGVPLRHIEMGRNVPMYRTNIACRPAGVFHGPMVVSMRPMTPAQAVLATQVCSRFPRAHGAPIHFGDPSAIGVYDLDRPDFGEAVEIRPGEVPIFWACGVTPQAVALEARLPLVLTHQPGHMFVTDLRDTELEGDEITYPLPPMGAPGRMIG